MREVLELVKLIGILLVAVGFLFRLNTLLVVMVAGIVTGMVSGLSFYDAISMFGKFFIENRYMSMPIILTLPVIGILERYGLKERAEALITKSKGATTGRVLMSYFTIRESSAALGLNIGGHAQTVRPLVAPMAEGAAQGKYGKLPEKLREKLKQTQRRRKIQHGFRRGYIYRDWCHFINERILRFSRYACWCMGYGALGYSNCNISTYRKLDQI